MLGQGQTYDRATFWLHLMEAGPICATRRLHMVTETDRIEKKILLRAPRKRVWRALTETEEFGAWFGMKFEGPFMAGSSVRGTIVPTQVDTEVARLQKEFEGLPFEFTVEQIEPER